MKKIISPRKWGLIFTQGGDKTEKEVKFTEEEIKKEHKAGYDLRDGGFFILKKVFVDEEASTTRIVGLNIPSVGRGFDREIILKKPARTCAEAWQLMKDAGF